MKNLIGNYSYECGDTKAGTKLWLIYSLFGFILSIAITAFCDAKTEERLII
jgi:hypothetical protein